MVAREERLPSRMCREQTQLPTAGRGMHASAGSDGRDGRRWQGWAEMAGVCQPAASTGDWPWRARAGARVWAHHAKVLSAHCSLNRALGKKASTCVRRACACVEDARMRPLVIGTLAVWHGAHAALCWLIFRVRVPPHTAAVGRRAATVGALIDRSPPKAAGAEESARAAKWTAQVRQRQRPFLRHAACARGAWAYGRMDVGVWRVGVWAQDYAIRVCPCMGMLAD